MGRVRSYQTCHTTKPENCPHCGKHGAIEELTHEEAHSLARLNEQGVREEAAWQCRSCEAIIFRCAEDQ